MQGVKTIGIRAASPNNHVHIGENVILCGEKIAPYKCQVGIQIDDSPTNHISLGANHVEARMPPDPEIVPLQDFTGRAATRLPNRLLHLGLGADGSTIQIGNYTAMGELWSSGATILGDNAKPADPGSDTMQIMTDLTPGYGARAIKMSRMEGITFHAISGDPCPVPPCAGEEFHNEVMRITNAGHVGIGQPMPLHPLHMSSGAHCTAEGMWVDSSSRERKDGFAPIDPASILQKVIDLPLTRWKYKNERDGISHIGPVSEDFYAGFGTGADEKHLVHHSNSICG